MARGLVQIILKGTIDKLSKPNERLFFYILSTKEKSVAIYAEQLKKYKCKYILK